MFFVVSPLRHPSVSLNEMDDMNMRNFTLFCPLFTNEQIEKGLKKGKFLYDEGMLEKRCSICGDYWPADTEFFYTDTKAGLHPNCKACYDHNRRMKRLKDKAA